MSAMKLSLHNMFKKERMKRHLNTAKTLKMFHNLDSSDSVGGDLSELGNDLSRKTPPHRVSQSLYRGTREGFPQRLRCTMLKISFAALHCPAPPCTKSQPGLFTYSAAHIIIIIIIIIIIRLLLLF